MFSFLNIDGKFYKTLSKITNYAILGVLWVISCAGIITIGAACAAVYAAHHKVIQNGNDYIWDTYWQQFRTNFKQSTILWLIMVLLGGFFAADYYLLFMMSGGQQGILVIFGILAAVCIMWMQYWLPYIVHIDDPIKAVLKNTLIMTVAHLPQSILLLAIFGLCAIINFEVPPLAWTVTLIITPILYSYLSYGRFCKVFTNYWDMTDGNADFEEMQLERED